MCLLCDLKSSQPSATQPEHVWSARRAFVLAGATAAGTAALLSPGTELCRPVDVFRLLDQVSVTAVDASA